MTNSTNPNKIKGRENDTKNTVANRRAERRRNKGNAESADWQSAPPQLLSDLIGLVTFHKATITFGYTKDGGAYYLNYYFESESEKIYIRPTEDLELRLQEEIESWSI